MYKPPQNTNRVKSIKSKFENFDCNTQASPEKKLVQNSGYNCSSKTPIKFNASTSKAFDRDSCSNGCRNNLNSDLKGPPHNKSVKENISDNFLRTERLETNLHIRCATNSSYDLKYLTRKEGSNLESNVNAKNERKSVCSDDFKKNVFILEKAKRSTKCANTLGISETDKLTLSDKVSTSNTKDSSRYSSKKSELPQNFCPEKKSVSNYVKQSFNSPPMPLQNTAKNPRVSPKILTVNGHSKKTEYNRNLNSENSLKPTLSRQLSDPVKRNIKRTPAFRLDKSADRDFQRNAYDRSTLFENKVKQYNCALKNCDSSKNFIKDSAIGSPCAAGGLFAKPLLLKSKSSHDFQYIRSKFNRSENISTINQSSDVVSNNSKDNELKGIDLSLLYTEPVPKSLRNKNNSDTVEEPTTVNDDSNLPCSIYNTSTLKIGDIPRLQKSLEDVSVPGLSDTLKTALRKPLPPGPAPQKPPRTFQHCVQKVMEINLEKNKSFLHVPKKNEELIKNKPKNSPKKGDPKYMLNKLENALRNNKLRVRKQAKTDVSTTSGEDSDDSLLFRSKSSRSCPKLPKNNSEHNFAEAFSDLNCFNGMSCTNPVYEKVKEPNSSFFVNCRSEQSKEPLYAEPFHFRNGGGHLQDCKNADVKRTNRNSLHYMSTSVLNEERNESQCDFASCEKQEMESKIQELNENRSILHPQISAENSSLSSFTSDLDSTPSPMDDSQAKIKSLIECFETRLHSTPQSSQSTPTGADNTTRLENLRNSLKKTIDKSFTCDSPVKDSDSEKNEENKLVDIISKFQTYIKSMPKYCQPKIDKDKLFYCCLIIEKVRDCAQIKYKFPPNADIPHHIERLCFPESDDSLPMDTSQSYSVLITNDKGERLFGYCRRVLPEGSLRCLPLAYCILSKYRAQRFYKKILEELESRHGMRDKCRDNLIAQFYSCKFPQPGESIRVNLQSVEPKFYSADSRENLSDILDRTSFAVVGRNGEYGTINRVKRDSDSAKTNDVNSFREVTNFSNGCVNEELVLTLHPDSRYEDADLKRLHQLPEDILLKIFSSLLLERKVILISSVISELSSCVDCLQSILYPFTWHHTFIPILPESLWEIVESPTPVICGVLSGDVVEIYNIENGIVVNIDTYTILKEEGDENKILTGSMQKVWKRSVALAKKAATSADYVHSVYLADAYLQVFVMCFKNYKDFIIDGKFQKEDFIKNAKTKGIRRFLKMFTETYMFHAFLDCALNNPENLIAFDNKIEMYGSDESSAILDKLLDWNR